MTSCLICLDDTHKKELYVTSCNHIFHKTCLLKIDNLEKVRNLNDEMKFNIIQCPLCRTKISIPEIFRKQYSCMVLNDKIFHSISNLYIKLNDLNLNKNYVFITGYSAKVLYNLINYNIDNVNDDDLYGSFLSSHICYIDYDDLYNCNNINEKYMKNIYDINYYTNYIKDVKVQKRHRIMYINKNNHCNTNLNKHIRIMFDNCKINSYKICFIIKDNYIDFYIHSDFYKNNL